MLQHRLRINIARHQQQHVLRLIPALHIGTQVISGDGAHGFLKADDGTPVGGVLECGHLQAFKQPAHGRILIALKLGNHHFFFRLQLLGIQSGLKGHFFHHVHAHAPVGSGHVRHVPCLVKAGGRVEVAAKGFHITRHLALGPVLCTFEDHVLQQMADARLLGVLIGRTGAHVKTRCHQREAAVLDDIHGKPVGQFGQGSLFARCGRGRASQQGQQEGQ